MALKKTVRMLVVCLLAAFGSVAWPQEAASLRVVVGSGGEAEVLFSLGGSVLLPVGSAYAEVDAPGMTAVAAREGLPALPVLTRLVPLPLGTELSVDRVEPDGESRLTLGRDRVLLPWQGAAVKGCEPAYGVLPDKEAYGQQGFWSAGDPVEVENLGAMGEVQMWRVRVNPAAYSPSAGEVRLTTGLRATLKVKRKSGRTSDPSAAGRYLVVSRPEFREGLQPFVRWKRQVGYEVKEIYVDTSLCDSVRAAIAGEWRGGADRWPRYVLLVGDARKIQAFRGTTAPTGLLPTITDLYYVEHTGDYLPDAQLGRWPVNDSAELRAVVEKTLAYERAEAMDTHLLKRVMLVAGYERYNPAPITTNGQVNYVGRELKHARPQLDTLCWRNPASEHQRDGILEALGRGAAMLNYTAHCTTGGWTSPAVGFRSIDTLPLRQPLLYVNNCCESNNFGGTCFGEQLLRKPGGGAIGVVGATNSTLWDEDFYWSVGPKMPFTADPLYDSLRPGAFDCWLGRVGGVATQGELLQAGNLAVSASGSPYDKFYWEIYSLLGDPSLMPYVGVPQAIELAVVDTPAVGAVQLALRGTAGVRVGVVQADSLLATGVFPPDGRLTLGLGQSVDTGALVLTATGSGRLTRVDTVLPLAAERAAGLYRVHYADSLLSFTLTNQGRQPLRNVTVGLLQDSAGFGGGAEMRSGMARVDSLAAGASARLALDCRMVAVGQEPLWRGLLVAADTARLCTLGVEHRLATAYPECSLRLCGADSTEASTLEAGGSYLLRTTVEGAYDSLRVRLSPLPAAPAAEGHGEWTPFGVAAGVHHMAVEARVDWGHWSQRTEGYFSVGGDVEGFERGFGCYPWQQGGTQPWVVDSSVSRSGRFSVRSGPIDYRQTSDLVIEPTLPQAGTLTFYARASSEEMYDKLVFSVDGVSREQAWGEMGWTRYRVNLAAGRHVLRWRYVKDETGSEGSDCVWIDDVEFPLVLWDSAYGCEGTARLSLAPAAETSRAAVYPNPAGRQAFVALQNTGGGVRLALTDIYGRTLMEKYADAASVVPIDLSAFGRGVYLLKISFDGAAEVHKLIVN